MPIAIILGASYSIDALTIGIIGIFIAYVLKLNMENKETITFRQFLILLGLMVLCLLCKNGAYFGICTLIFLLPIMKSIKKDKKILCTVIIIIMLALGFGMYEGIKISTNSQGDSRVDGTSPIKQIEFLLEKPSNILTVYINYIRSSIFNLNWYTGFNLKVFCGPYYSIIAYILFIFVLYKSITDNTYVFNKKEKIIDFVLCLFLGYLGVHKFYEKKIGLGLLYLFTLGIFGFGWIFDTIKLLCNLINSTKSNNETQEKTSNISIFDTNIAGVTFDNRQDLLQKCQLKQKVFIKWDKNNPYSKTGHSLSVFTNIDGEKKQLGYIPEKSTDELFNKYATNFTTDSNFILEGYIDKITGGTTDKPSLGCIIKIPYEK